MAALSGDAGEGGALGVQARMHAAVGALTSAVAGTLGGLSLGEAAAGSEKERPERVLAASFASLESPGGAQTRCLFLSYASGWAAWSEAPCCELVSLRDGPVTAVLPLPQPERREAGAGADAGSAGGGDADAAAAAGADALSDDARPLVAVAGPEAPPASPADAPEAAGASSGASRVRFYSLREQRSVRTQAFRSPVLALRATARVVAVALDSQVYGLDAATLEVRTRGACAAAPTRRAYPSHVAPRAQVSFSVLTYRSPAPPLSLNGSIRRAARLRRRVHARLRAACALLC
jgi:hypothetical protein